MVIHPDGKLEGTPDELAAYQRAMLIVVEKVADQTVYAPQFYPTTCDVTYQGPEIIANN